MPRTKRDTRPLTLTTIIPADAPKTVDDLTPEQAETAYRALGLVFHTLATVRARRLAQQEAEAA